MEIVTDKAPSISKSSVKALPKLTKFLRLTIYGYIELKETVLKLASLSKQERQELLKSHIARGEKKKFVLNLT